MSDYLKLLTKDYFNHHPLKEISAARFSYSFLLHPEVEGMVEEAIPELKKQGLKFPEDGEQIARITQAEDTSKLLRMARQALSPKARSKLLDKLLAREAEVLPEIQSMILKAFNSYTIETCMKFMVRCQTNCSEWIIQNYGDVRQPYARSCLCLVLGFRADADAIPFLMNAVDVFERECPTETFDQAPLLALHEIRARFA